MNRFMLACIGGALALALVAMPAPVGAQDDPWPGIRAAYRDGAFDQAIASLKAVLAQHPDDREALYYTAIIQWRLEDYTAAARAYRRVLALDPEGPFGQDARQWLGTYGHLAQPEPVATPEAVALAVPTVRPAVPRQAPKPAVAALPKPGAAPARPKAKAPRRSVLPFDALRPQGRSGAPWLQAQPKGKNRRARSANPRPGYFKLADGSCEFVPPLGFVLLDERTQGAELSTLFGLVAAGPAGVPGEAPPTLLITWREVDELKGLRPDQRAARERQLLAMEASMYGPGAHLEGRFGGPCYRVRQIEGHRSADTLLFFQHRKLYALTFGGTAEQLARYAPRVEKSWATPLFYP